MILFTFLLLFSDSVLAQFGQQNPFLQQNQQLQQQSPVARTQGLDQFGQAFTEYEGNLVRYGTEFGDEVITDNQRQNGKQIRLHNFFPFYGGRYNYTMISTNGYVSFAYFSDDASTLQLGVDVDWPTQSDPALIAPYLCKQRIQRGQGVDSAVYYRLEVRKASARASPFATGITGGRSKCLGKDDYVRCDDQSEQFLDAFQRSLQQGVAGASTFRAEAALVVTWKNLRPNIGSEEGLSTYQLVWAADAQGYLSYSMINYYKLGYDAADVNGNQRTGKCQAVFNGGNHTGTVQVDLSDLTKQQPSSLAHRSSVPHVTRGRYFHRVDDIVRPAGCSNKTGGTFPLLIYPNIVSMLGQTKVDVNGLCLNPSTTYVLMIEQRQMAKCEVLNPSMARCTLPKILDWGTKTVYFQPQSGLSNDEKAYVGFIYFVPPTIDPMRLDIGDLHSWYVNPTPTHMSVKWYPRNFSQPRIGTESNFFDDSIYNIQLGLYVVGYKEAQDDHLRKFVPKHRVLARLATFQNRADEQYRWNPMIEKFQLDHVDEWYIGQDEFRSELFTYRFGYLKLAPIVQTDTGVVDPHHGRNIELEEGIISSPISLHWMWTLPTNGDFSGNKQDKHQKTDYVKEKAREMCHDWYDEDGALTNLVRDTETNSSCPCRASQAELDIGRFMPHPRCSKLFRDVSCTETLGSMNCFMSAQNVRGSTHDRKTDQDSTYNTHYGQTCCYDNKGYLMQSSYQPVVKIDDSTPYSPGFPTRAYEMGSEPFQGMFEVPGLSSFHHDIMPYYLCCKFAEFRCQMFYWRRPSSACQAYEPPVTGSIQGAGVISTLNNRNLVFNEPGIFTLLHAHKSSSTPEVQIQIRAERFPDRSVDFGALNIEQRDLVQPTNTTVVTGVVISSEDAERVHVLLRKDTRRGRYKTSIIVGNVIRYFDNMHLQRFRGITVYVNNVEKGQADIFVVIDKAQIGLRIRETYAIDIDRKFQYMESLGLLDVTVSVPPQFKVNRGYESIGDVHRPRVEGLINPFPDEPTQDSLHSQLSWSSVNDAGTHQQLLKYQVKSELDTMSVNLAQQSDDVTDLFNSRSDQENLFQAFADHYLKGPVYKTSSSYVSSNYRFHPQTEMDFRSFLQFCRSQRSDPDYQSRETRKMFKRCPTDLASLEANCGNDVPCLFDAVMLQARLLGDEARVNYNTYQQHRFDGVAKYNSCGAMNIEYPEYLIKGPSSGEPAYLEGDKLSFSCYQTHIIKGNSEFTCSKHYNEHDRTYRMQWTMGEQPWCRHRTKDNVFTWLTWTAIILGVLTVIILIFAVCWSMKQSYKNKMARQQSEKFGTEMVPLNDKPLPPQFEGSDTGSNLDRFDREPKRRRDLAPPYSSARSSPSSGSPYTTYQRGSRPGELSV